MKLKTALYLPLDLLFLMRPVILIPAWGFSVFGYFCAEGYSLKELPLFWSSIQLKPFLLILLFSLSVAAVYVLNQIADIEVDKKNGGLPLIASGIISRKTSIIFSFFLILVSLLLPIFISQFQLVFLSICTLIIGYFYSFKPAYFSGRPIMDFVTNGFGYGIVAFAAGWSLSDKPIVTFEFFSASIPYFLLMCAGSISSTLPDRDGDLQENKNTTAVIFGLKKAHILATIMLFGALAISIYEKDLVAAICSIISIPFYIGYLIKPNTILMEATYKVGGGFCIVTASILFPMMLPAIFFVFLVTWLYFRLRHGVSYPSLVSVHK
jgi:4-hydroxybenzoate polyprenyltransferase